MSACAAGIPVSSLASDKLFPAVLRWLLLALFGAVCGASAPSTFAAPSPPRVLLETYPATLKFTGRSQTVLLGADLQVALDAARPGDELVSEAGQNYTGNFTLRRKTGTGWITLRSSAMSQLPVQGARVRPEQAAAMPKALSPDDHPALTAAPGAGFYLPEIVL